MADISSHHLLYVIWSQVGWPFAPAVWFTPLGHRTRINGWLQCVVRPSLNEASALGFRLCKVCGARLLLDR